MLLILIARNQFIRRIAAHLRAHYSPASVTGHGKERLLRVTHTNMHGEDSYKEHS